MILPIFKHFPPCNDVIMNGNCISFLRYAMRKFKTRLTMNYPLSFVIWNHSLLEMKVDIVQLIPLMLELWTRVTKIQGHAELTL
jgi:hypothetical protein